MRVQVRPERRRPRGLLGHRAGDLALLELNALGVIGGTSPGGTNWIYETHKNALITGGVLVVIYYALFYLILKA